VVLREGKRDENDAVDDLESLERKVDAGRSWNLDFKFAKAELRRDRNELSGGLGIAIFRKTERGQCGSIYGGVFVV
jgi:hypothetical protein